MYATASLLILLGCVAYSFLEEYRAKREHSDEITDGYRVSVFVRAVAVVVAIVLMIAAGTGHSASSGSYKRTPMKLECTEHKCKLEQEPEWFESLP